MKPAGNSVPSAEAPEGFNSAKTGTAAVRSGEPCGRGEDTFCVRRWLELLLALAAVGTCTDAMSFLWVLSSDDLLFKKKCLEEPLARRGRALNSGRAEERLEGRPKASQSLPGW